LKLLRALQAGSRYPSKTWQLAAVAILILVSGYFFLRGPWRAAEHSVDLPTFYTSARAWVLGLNPYDWDQLRALGRESGLQEHDLDRSLTPPMTLVAFSPLALLPYSGAKWVWLAMNLSFVALSLVELLRIVKFEWKEPRTLVFFIIALGLASIHTAISQGQLTIAATLFLVYALKFDLQKKTTLTGSMIALAGIFKPQVVILYGLYYLFRRQWQVVLVSAVIGTVALCIAIGRMEIAGVEGLQQWRENTVNFIQGAGDFAQPDSRRYLMMNLQVVLHQFIESHGIVNLIVIAVVGTILLVLATVPRHDESQQGLLLTYSCLAAMAPLALYSRFYSATLLIFPPAWALSSIRPGYIYLPGLVLLCIFVFFVPGVAILYTWSGQFPAPVIASWWWEYLLLPHQTYALLILLTCLVVAKLDWRHSSGKQRSRESLGEGD
jgi:Glycosyltransferase family 87